MIRAGVWSGFSVCALSSRSSAPRRRGALTRSPATWEDRRARRLRVAYERTMRAGAPRSRGSSHPPAHGNSDRSRKIFLLRTALGTPKLRRGLANSDRSRKGIVTSRARAKDDCQYVRGGSTLECSNLACESSANQHIHAGHGRSGGRPRCGCGEYRPATQAIETTPASNSDLTRKTIVTVPASNSDLLHKGIETTPASNSDLTRKAAVRTSCKTACFLGSDRAPLLCVCMFDVLDVYRQGGGGWG